MDDFVIKEIIQKITSIVMRYFLGNILICLYKHGKIEKFKDEVARQLLIFSVLLTKIAYFSVQPFNSNNQFWKYNIFMDSLWNASSKKLFCISVDRVRVSFYDYIWTFLLNMKMTIIATINARQVESPILILSIHRWSWQWEL